MAECWQIAGAGGACTEAAGSSSHPAAYVRLVVAACTVTDAAIPAEQL